MYLQLRAAVARCIKLTYVAGRGGEGYHRTTLVAPRCVQAEAVYSRTVKSCRRGRWQTPAYTPPPTRL